jgi:hypothetical protein
LVSGDPGLNGLCITTTDVQSGHGGGSHWGGGGRGRINQGGGSAGGGHGSGGSGAAIVSGGANQTGGSGKNGLIRVWEFQSTRSKKRPIVADDQNGKGSADKEVPQKLHNPQTQKFTLQCYVLTEDGRTSSSSF